MKRIQMIGSALSQLGNVMTACDLTKTGPNESISARSWRQKRMWRVRVIDAIFWFEPDHCKNAHLSDVADARALLKEVGEL